MVQKQINGLQKKIQLISVVGLTWHHLLLVVVLDLQALGPSREQLDVQPGEILFLNAEDVLVEFVQELGLLLPLLLLGLGLLNHKFLQELLVFCSHIHLSEAFLDQDLVDSYLIAVINNPNQEFTDHLNFNFFFRKIYFFSFKQD